MTLKEIIIEMLHAGAFLSASPQYRAEVDEVIARLQKSTLIETPRIRLEFGSRGEAGHFAGAWISAEYREGLGIACGELNKANPGWRVVEEGVQEGV